MQGHQGGQSSSRSAGVLRWAERLLVVAGAAMLVWCGVLLADASLAQRAARHSLETASHPEASVLSRVPKETTEGSRKAANVAKAAKVVRGSAIAGLSIPRVELSTVVLHGSDARTLRRGPGHLENTALPGESGNVVIAGHRDSFFRPLQHIRVGDDIFMDTPQRRFHYRVTSLRVVNPHDLSVLEPTDDATLTLITCYPFWVLGNAPDRFIVRATRVGEAAPVALPARTAPLREPIQVAVAQGAGVKASVVLKTARVPDDQALVREAIERFRVTYNARLISRKDARPGGPLRFQACEVVIDGDRADAACTAAAQSVNEGESPVWAAALVRADGGWAIRSILMD